MPTATATAVSSPQAQDLDMLQRRERLALAVKQAREQEEQQSAAITELGETLRDAIASGQPSLRRCRIKQAVTVG